MPDIDVFGECQEDVGGFWEAGGRFDPSKAAISDRILKNRSDGPLGCEVLSVRLNNPPNLLLGKSSFDLAMRAIEDWPLCLGEATAVLRLNIDPATV